MKSSGNHCERQLALADVQHFQRLDAKLQVIRDNVANVALGRTTGIYVYGTGGSSKSFTILGELERLEVNFKSYNSRMTGRGLFDVLRRFPDAVHVIEDAESLFRDQMAVGVLRSALWAQDSAEFDGPIERAITWQAHGHQLEFVFNGGVILTGNRPFPDTADLAAVKTRIAYLHLLVSDEEIAALMRNAAFTGYRKGSEELSPVECRGIAEFVIATCRGLNRHLDMRLYRNAIADYLLWNENQSGCHWKDLVAARIKERPTRIPAIRSVESRAEQKQCELDIARELVNIADRFERARVWQERTGKSEVTLYRRLQQLKAASDDAA